MRLGYLPLCVQEKQSFQNSHFTRGKMELLVPCLMILHLVSMPTTGQTPNTILSNGTIQWGQLGPDRPYKTVDFKVDVGGMEPWYSFSRSFISSALAEYFPISDFVGFANGTIEGKQLVATVVKTSPGYVFCLVFGLAFTIVFFCCCVCCCCCYCCCSSANEDKLKGTYPKGGYVTETDSPDGKSKNVPSNFNRTVMGVMFFVLIAIALGCGALVFESSRQINESVKGLNQSISDGLNDIDAFFENIKTQFTRIGEENFNFLSGALQGYISDVAGNVSKRLTEQISESVGLSTPLNKLSNYSEEAATLTSELNQAAKDVRTSRDSIVSDLTARCAAACGSQINGLKGLPLTELVAKTEDIKEKFATNVFTAITKTIDNRIKTEADKATKGVDPLSKLNDIFKDQVDPILEVIRTFHDKINNETSKMQKRSDDLIKEGDKIDSARFGLTLSPALIVVGVAVLALLGLFFGLLCSCLQGNSTNTFVTIGSMSLTSATIIIFLIGAPMMLVSTILFMFGSLLERYGCQTLMDYKKMEKYASASEFDVNLTNYTFAVVGLNVSLNFFDVMGKCEKGETMYCAVKMQDVVNVALQELWNYKEDLKISDKMDFSNTASAALGNLNVQKEIDALKGTVTSTDDLLSSISSIKTSLGGQANADLLKPMQDKLTVMESITNNLKQLALKFDVEASALPPLITQASTKLGDKAFVESVLQKAAKEVVDKVHGFVDSYRNDVITKLENDVGKCTPVVSITRAILNEALCRGVVDPLNGLWLSLSSCAVILVPILICAMALPDYFVGKSSTKIEQTDSATPSAYVPYSRATPGANVPSTGATPGAFMPYTGPTPGAYGPYTGTTPGAYVPKTGETQRSKASMISTEKEESEDQLKPALRKSEEPEYQLKPALQKSEEASDSDMKWRDKQRTVTPIVSIAESDTSVRPDRYTSSSEANVDVYSNISPSESSVDPFKFDKTYRRSYGKYSTPPTRTSSEVAANPSVSFNKANSSGSFPK